MAAQPGGDLAPESPSGIFPFIPELFSAENAKRCSGKSETIAFAFESRLRFVTVWKAVPVLLRCQNVGENAWHDDWLGQRKVAHSEPGYTLECYPAVIVLAFAWFHRRA